MSTKIEDIDDIIIVYKNYLKYHSANLLVIMEKHLK